MKMTEKPSDYTSPTTDTYPDSDFMEPDLYTSSVASSATSILRQLIDAGTLSNLPAGLKARGLRIKGDDSPLMPGKFRDVDVPGGAIARLRLYLTRNHRAFCISF